MAAIEARIDLLSNLYEAKHTSTHSCQGYWKHRVIEGPLEDVFGGVDPLSDIPYPASVHPVSAAIHSTVLEFVVKEASNKTSYNPKKASFKYFQEESIGVDCTPRCGGCFSGM